MMGGVPLSHVLVSVAVGVLLLWLLLVGLWAVQRNGPDRITLTAGLRLLPDIVRLLRRLAADPQLPRGVRIRLALLLGYLLLPIDLIPDVIPVVGHLDDAIIVALALRSVVRRAGPSALTRHWPYTPDGLAAVPAWPACLVSR
jgi:uncharacterized membrane protein YkvA (DUF1232 family)